MADTSDTAKQQYEALLAERGETDGDTLQAQFAYGNALMGEAQYTEAEAVGRSLLAVFEREFGEDHPNTGYGLDLISIALRAQGKAEDALGYSQTAVDRLESHFGPDHEMTLQRARGLAIIYGEMGRVDEGKAVLDRYAEAAAQIPPLNASFMGTRAFLETEGGNPAGAAEITEQLVAFYRTHEQEQTSDFASTLFNLALVYVDLDRENDALDALSEAGIIALQTYGPEHPASQDIFNLHSHLREKLGV